jgi:prophage regulatory protein
MAERFISSTDVKERVGLSKTEIYRRIAAGTFPKQVPLGEHRIAFLESEIEAWIAARVVARASDEGAAERRDRAADAKAHHRQRSGRRK